MLVKKMDLQSSLDLKLRAHQRSLSRLVLILVFNNKKNLNIVVSIHFGFVAD